MITIKVLIADDLESSYINLKAKIEKINISNVTINIIEHLPKTPFEAYNTIKSERADIVFLDIDFGVANGNKEEGLDLLKQFNLELFYESTFVLCSNFIPKNYEKAKTIANFAMLGKLDEDYKFEEVFNKYVNALMDSNGKLDINRMTVIREENKKSIKDFLTSVSKQDKFSYTISNAENEETVIDMNSVLFIKKDINHIKIYSINNPKTPIVAHLSLQLSDFINKAKELNISLIKSSGSAAINNHFFSYFTFHPKSKQGYIKVEFTKDTITIEVQNTKETSNPFKTFINYIINKF
jgi:DNA-binding LytR/AlgR family response regulator